MPKVVKVEAPSSVRDRIGVVGPGLLIAATGVGAGDLVASLVAGTNYGLVFVWAILLGAALKYFLTEGVGRWHLATGQTILQGWHSLGRLATGYFGVYVVVWAFVFGAAVASSAALGLSAMFPVLPLWAWAILNSLAGFALVWFGRYGLVERVMKVLVGLMFVTVVGSAVLILPTFGEFAGGLTPRVPDGSLLYLLGLIGGVGGTVILASYGYWLREKGWRGSDWVPTMRTDAFVAYAITALFILATLIIGARFLYGTGQSIEGEDGLLGLANLMGEQFGSAARWLFLVGFWATSFTSLLGAWNGIPYLFADFARIARSGADSDAPVSEKGLAYRGFLIWMTFPPMVLLFFGEPVGLVIVYAALGALFMPFLAITLLWLLNSRRVEPRFRNGLVSNVFLGASVLIFVILAAQELAGLL